MDLFDAQKIAVKLEVMYNNNKMDNNNGIEGKLLKKYNKWGILKEGGEHKNPSELKKEDLFSFE